MRLLPFVLALGLPGAAAASPHVLELFTSQSCSSCPPADALLTELARRPDVLALDFHVDYWDGLGWRDRFSAPWATARQRAYAGRLGTETYTPELVIDGRRAVVGSDRAAVLAVLAAQAGAAPAITIAAPAGRIAIAIGAGAGRAQILVVGFDPRHETAVAGGENGGRVLSETNVVRSLVAIGAWSGRAMRLSVPAPEGERHAVLLQAEDGSILGAAASQPERSDASLSREAARSN